MKQEDYSKYPKFLYQYLKFDINFINNLINNQLWFSDPKTFNDPYDSCLTLDTTFTKEEIRKFLDKINISNTFILKILPNAASQLAFIKHISPKDLPDDQIFETIDRVLNRDGLVLTETHIQKRITELTKDPLKTKVMLEKVVESEISNYRVLCLSLTRTNNIMWSHYSDKHTGVCIKLDTSKDYPFFTFPLKVSYKFKYPLKNYIQDHDDHNSFSTIFRTKYLYWKYEREIRIIKDIRTTQFINKGLLNFNKEALMEINFGLRAPLENIRLVESIINKYYDNKVKINQAIKKGFSFVLAFERIN